MRKLPAHETQNALNELPAHIRRGIGQVCSAHAVLELTMEQILSDTLRLDYGLGRLSLPNEGPLAQFKIAKRLFNYWDFKPSISIATIYKELEDCAIIRNELAHGIWFKFSGNYYVREIVGDYKDDDAGQISRALLPTSKPVDAHYCYEAAQRIQGATKMLQTVQQEINSALISWPRTTPGQPPRCTNCEDRSPLEL